MNGSSVCLLALEAQKLWAEGTTLCSRKFNHILKCIRLFQAVKASSFHSTKLYSITWFFIKCWFLSHNEKKDAKQSLTSGFSPFISLAIKRSCNKGFIFEAFQIYKVNIYGNMEKYKEKRNKSYIILPVRYNPIHTWGFLILVFFCMYILGMCICVYTYIHINIYL